MAVARRRRFERVHARRADRAVPRRGAGRRARASCRSRRSASADDAQALAMPYLHSKLRADDALAALPLDWAVLRPSLVLRPAQPERGAVRHAGQPAGDRACRARGAQRVQPIHVYEVAEAIVRLLEGAAAGARVHRARRPAADELPRDAGHLPRRAGPGRRRCGCRCRCALMAAARMAAPSGCRSRCSAATRCACSSAATCRAQRGAGAARPRAHRAGARPGDHAGAAAASTLRVALSPAGRRRRCARRSPSCGSTPR